MSSDDKELADSLRAEHQWEAVNEYEKVPVPKNQWLQPIENPTATFGPNIYDTLGSSLPGETEPKFGGSGKEPPVKATATGEDDFEQLKRRVASLGVKEALELYKYIKMQLGI